MRKIQFLFLLFLLISCDVFSDNITDSLIQKLESSYGNEKVKLLLSISERITKKEPEEAIKYSNRALQIATLLNDNNSLSDCYHTLGLNYVLCAKYDSALYFLENALELRENLNDKSKLANTLYRIGGCYYLSDNYNKARESYNDARILFKEIGDQKMEIVMLIGIGLTNKKLGNYKSSIEAYSQALLISELIDDAAYSSQALNNIAGIYIKLQEYDKALDYYQRAFEIRKELNDNMLIASSYHNIGLCYSYSDSLDIALEYFFKAVDINKKINNYGYLILNYNGICNTYNRKQEYTNALKYLDISIELSEKRNNKKGLSYAYYSKAKVYLKLTQYDKAIEFFNKSLFISKKIGLISKIRDCYLQLSKIHIITNDYEKALKYDTLYVAIKDSLFNKEMIETIAEIETKYETDKIDKENEILRKNAESRKRIQQILILAGLMLLVIVILLFFLFRMKSRTLIKSMQVNEKEKLLKELESKNQETEKKRLEELVFAEKKVNDLQKDKLNLLDRQLSMSAMQVLNKTEILDEVKKELEKEDFKDVSESTSYKKLLQKIDENKAVDHDWNQFKKHFESVHKGFFIKLQQQYPSLTNNDLKLCAYIRIGLSTKEMARMLNVTTAAIDKSRQRLKKKLQLDASGNLSAFISTF